MPDTERRILKGHQARTAPRVPAGLALIGLGLIAAGVALGLVGAGVLRPEPRVPAPAVVPYEERYVAEGESSSTQSEQVWADVLPLPPARGRVGGIWTLPIELRLPVGPYETQLADRPPQYWELEVRGEAPGLDFGATFLLPVYTAGVP